MYDWINKAFCDINGVPDEARICAVAMVLAYLMLAFVDIVFHGASFDMQAFGIGAGALSGGIGGWFKLLGNE